MIFESIYRNMIKLNWFKILLLSFLPIFYVFFIGRFGLEDSDSGFIVGMGWRIVNGELPYKDFFYVRPPISIYLSSLYLRLTPVYGQVLVLRLINNFQLLIQVFLTVFILNKNYNFKNLNIDIYKFSLLCYFITLSGTLYFQWHTTDGIFFAVLGIFIISFLKKNNYAYFFSGILFCLSMLTKQNFIMIPILGIIFVFLKEGFIKTVLTTLGVITGLFSFYLYLFNNNLIDDYLLLTVGASNLKDLFIAGIAYYFVRHEYLFLYVIIVFFSFFLYLKFIKKSISVNIKISNQSVIFFILIFILLIFSVSYVLIFESNERVIAYDRILPVIVFTSFFYLFIFNKDSFKNHYALLLLLGFSWCSSISWGGMTPIMYFTPVIFSTYYLLKIHTKSLDNKYLNKVIYFMIIVISVAQVIVPYRNGFFWKNHNDGAILSSKLAFIKVNNDFFNKHSEFKIILNKYKKSTILPSMPGSSYLYDVNNPFIIDWAMDVESNYNRKFLFSNINTCCEYIIVEKHNLGQPIGTSGKFYSSVTDYVVNNFKLIDQSFYYFDVYKGLKLNDIDSIKMPKNMKKH